ncbi:MAG TPA: cupin domain-containing protein [Candidatus Angelobacter sp.]|nr:cupin domain-containing protein [Candidatus Angelobacter sp.]
MKQEPHSELVSSSANPDALECRSFLDLNREIAQLQGDTSFREDAGRRSKMLAKYPEFRLVLVTMKPGTRWSDHKTSSRILVQVLRGRIRFHTPNAAFELRIGQLITLDPGVLHSVDSLEESAFLLTLSSAANQ